MYALVAVIVIYCGCNSGETRGELGRAAEHPAAMRTETGARQQQLPQHRVEAWCEVWEAHGDTCEEDVLWWVRVGSAVREGDQKESMPG